MPDFPAAGTILLERARPEDLRIDYEIRDLRELLDIV